MARAAQPLAAKARSSEFVRELRAAYDEGRAGDDGTDGCTADAGVDPCRAGDSDSADDGAGSRDEPGDAAAVSAALRAVDWAAVRAATAEKSSEAAQRMKTLAAEVDWAKVQAGAARVSSALIAAVASGHLPVGGRLAGPVARAIINEGGLAQRVHHSLRDAAGTTELDDLADFPDVRNAIDTTASDTTASDTTAGETD